jgi:sensor histidine kinase
MDDARRSEYLELIKEQAGVLIRLCKDKLLLSRLDSQAGVNLDENVRVGEQLRKVATMLMQNTRGGSLI